MELGDKRVGRSLVALDKDGVVSGKQGYFYSNSLIFKLFYVYYLLICFDNLIMVK